MAAHEGRSTRVTEGPNVCGDVVSHAGVRRNDVVVQAGARSISADIAGEDATRQANLVASIRRRRSSG